jgi:hypothetical protein
MKLVCPTEPWMSKYKDLYFQRTGQEVWPSRLALLAVEGQDLIAGVMVYDTSGPFLFFEHLVTNETAPLRVRWEGVDLMASEIRAMCRMVGKLPFLLIRHRGIERIIRRYGLQSTGAVAFSCAFSDLEQS